MSFCIVEIGITERIVLRSEVLLLSIGLLVLRWKIFLFDWILKW